MRASSVLTLSQIFLSLLCVRVSVPVCVCVCLSVSLSLSFQRAPLSARPQHAYTLALILLSPLNLHSRPDLLARLRTRPSTHAHSLPTHLSACLQQYRSLCPTPYVQL